MGLSVKLPLQNPQLLPRFGFCIKFHTHRIINKIYIDMGLYIKCLLIGLSMKRLVLI